MTPSEAPEELLDPTRANCWISAQHQPGKFRSAGWEFDLRPNTGTLQAIRAMAVISSVAATAWYGTLAVVIWSQQICFRFLMALPCRISYSSQSVPIISSIEFHQFPWGTPLLKTSGAVCSCVWWAVLLELPTRDHQSTPKRAH